MSIRYKEYVDLKGEKKRLIERVQDGSIIVRFDKTPNPKHKNDVVCPHFLELKWGYGCPYSCAWCYLQGTYRWPQFKKHGSNIDPVIKNEKKIEKHLKIISQNGHKEILNAGELADSLMLNWLPRFLLNTPLGGNKVLFVSKSDHVDFLVENKERLKEKIVISFTLNAVPVADKWERGAPKVSKRIKAAEHVSEAGYTVRIRIDPMVPIHKWEDHYKQLIDDIFEKFTPERITLGSLRGLQSTINQARDKSWVTFMKEKSNWGKKIPIDTRLKLYSKIMNYLMSRYNYSHLAFCKETVEIWNRLGLDYKEISCNCI
ncbi:MAG: hypothetical protein V3T58_07125 [Candidatus Hydrothermarchaeales archaeon]